MKRIYSGTVVALLATATAVANEVELDAGSTSVALDVATLESAASLRLVGVSEGIHPGALRGSVAFPINPRDSEAPALPTTFEYNTEDFLGSFGGTIEHTGSVFFDIVSAEPRGAGAGGDVEVGNFTIGFDANRIGTLQGQSSGFFVESTTGIAAILFDIKNPSELIPASRGPQIRAELLVSPEFAGFLQANDLAEVDLSGASVGEALVRGKNNCTAVDLNDDGDVDRGDLRKFLLLFKLRDDRANFDGFGARPRGFDLIQFNRQWRSCRNAR